jgi:hypothetical protein
MSAYYQRRVHPSDWWKLAIATHRGHEMWTVAPMGLAISPAHQQRFMDKLLKKLRWKVAACYIDDMVVYSATFEEHIRDLSELLTLVDDAGLTFNPAKCFCGYHTLGLLGIIVDSLGLSTTKERAQAILEQPFPKTLLQLENFLGVTGYTRSLVPYYAQVIEPLHKLKIELLKKAPYKGRARKDYCTKTPILVPTKPQRDAFELIKKIIGSEQTLRHPDYDRPFIVYVDASREYGFGVAVYQSYESDQGKDKEHPVMFLSRALKPAEERYWPTELEAAGIVWAVHKISHIIQVAKVILYTDHKACEAIAKMKSLETTSPAKKNLRLANWGIFLSQYWNNLEIRYVRGVENVVADALSRLRTQIMELNREEKRLRLMKEQMEDEPVGAFLAREVLASLLQIEPKLRRDISTAYNEDTYFGPILRTIRAYLTEHPTQVADNRISRPKSPYVMLLPAEEPLLFWRDDAAGTLRLCIPRSMSKVILELAHDKENHYGLAKTYNRLINTYFFPQLLKLLKTYIAHCPKCMINRTLRHKPYGDAQPIQSPSTPFHCITMDFVLGLPPSRRFSHGDELFDTILTITDKFTKAVKLLVGKNTYSAEDWATRYWQDVYPAWGLPAAIISDRDPKFLSQFWKGLFEKAACTKLLTSTAYHPQTDGQSERTNQTFEVALRNYVNIHQTNWADLTDIVEASINTAISATTKKSPFEILYGFNPKHVVEMVSSNGVENADDWASIREIYRKEASDAIVNAQAAMAAQMDSKSIPISYAVGDKVYLRLHHGYTLPSTIKSKISQQRAGPFIVEATVGKNAYRLALPPTWKIWPVISVVFLEPAPKGTDPFGRVPPPAPPIIVEEDALDGTESFEVAAIVKKRYNRRRRQNEYLVRWKDYGPEHDQWFVEDELTHCIDLLHEYEMAIGNTTWTPPHKTLDDALDVRDEASELEELGVGEEFIPEVTGLRRSARLTK